MLTVNINLQDKLANCQLGTSKHISIDTNSNVTKIYIKFDDSKAGLKKKYRCLCRNELLDSS